jgi:DNA repair protein RAD16
VYLALFLNLILTNKCIEGTEDYEEGTKKVKCPECGTRISVQTGGGVSSKPKIQFEKTSLHHFRRSAKLTALVDELLKLQNSGDGLKSVVFSQFTTYMGNWFVIVLTVKDLIEVSLKAKGIKYQRLDGTMTHQKRSVAIDQFKTNPSVNVFLASLRAGGVGLNLSEACRVFLLDPWWNVSHYDALILFCSLQSSNRQLIVSTD